MRRITVLLALLLLSAVAARAVVAPETPYPYTQPDGTVILLVNHGDEFYNWVTCEGQVVEKDAQGYYRPVSSPELHRRRSSAARTLRQQANELRSSVAQKRLGMGDKHFLVILVEFADLEFTIPSPREAFDQLLNQPGYSQNGGTGSVRDFYMDNSAGAFSPTFDVVGPVKVPKGYAYYGEQDGDDVDLHADEALYDACTLLDSSVDFSSYDLDHDGYVDNIYFYYAGYNQAEGGGDDTIWPHQWALYRHRGIFDGVRVWSYACSSEYKGNEGENMTGIGTFVHEFGHVIGLPDFYDTDYEENGSASHPGSFSTMAGGNYLNEGRTPCCFTSVERQLLGWMEDFQEISTSGEYVLGALGDHVLPFATQADVPGEQFIYEYRNGKGWDSFLPEGMVVYQMDRSENICHGSLTAKKAWNSGRINVYAEHPCFQIIPSVQGSKRPASMVFPGQNNVREFTPVAWSGKELAAFFCDIRLEGGQMMMTVDFSALRRVSGTVTDNEGRPLEGAAIVLGVEEAVGMGVKGAAGLGQRLLSLRPRGEEIRYQTTSGADGSFVIHLDAEDQTAAFRVGVSCQGYIEQARDLSFSRSARCNFALRPAGYPSRADLKHFDLSANEDLFRMGFGENSRGILGASYFRPDELKPYSGMLVQTISFVLGSEAKQVHVLIDSDSRRLLVQEVPTVMAGGFTEVDVSEQKIAISAETGMYFGYAVLEPDDGYPLVIQTLPGESGFHYASYDLDSMAWTEYPGDYALLVAVTLWDPAASQYVTLGTLDVNSIDNPQRAQGYAAGDVFTFRLAEALYDKPSQVIWYYDGERQSAPQVVLTSGTHLIKAHLSFPSGEEEDVFLELPVR